MMIPELKHFQEFLQAKGLSKSTIRQYTYYFNRFIKYPGMTQETIARYLAEKGNDNLIGRSFLKNLKKYLLLYSDRYMIPLEAKAKIGEIELPRITGRKPKKLTNPLTEGQILRMEKFMESEEDKIKLLFSFYCGLRLDELHKITILSFNWEEWAEDTEKMGRCKVYGKGNKENIALVPSPIMKRVATFIKKTNYDDLNSRIFTVGERTWQRKLRDAGVRSGVSKLDLDGNIIKGTQVYPHKLRHSYATHLLRKENVDLMDVKNLLRHADIKSTQIYVHTNLDDIENKLEPGFGEKKRP